MSSHRSTAEIKNIKKVKGDRVGRYHRILSNGKLHQTNHEKQNEEGKTNIFVFMLIQFETKSF